MMITITPFTINPNCSFVAPLGGYEREDGVRKDYLPITYWGVYLNDKYISYTSSKELAEKTKVWLEKWFKDRV